MDRPGSALLGTVKHLQQVDQLTNRFMISMAAELRALDTMFDLMSLEAGWFDLNLQEVDLKQMVKRIIGTISDYMEVYYSELERYPYKIVQPRVEYIIPAKLPFVNIDALRIERIVTEALLAAVQLTRNRESKIKFLVGCDHHRLTIEVSDNREGLPAHLKNQPPDLPLTHRAVIERHKGKWEIRKQNGGGWLMKVSLPID